MIIMAVTDPAPTWPIEPTILYVVTYYPTNALEAEPDSIDLVMKDLESAVARAKELITDAENVGVCTIQQVCATIVYPAIPWEAF
jgi:hypothetical protein